MHAHTEDAPREDEAASTSSANAPKAKLASQPDPQPQAQQPSNDTADGIAITKPANDDLQYRHLVLPNNLRVMLVSDPTTDKAGAAMDVFVGSLSDPDAFPGLAHFTEHMLFFSSEKYPVEDEYTKFISDHGGTTNAYTAAEHTNYHFDVNWEALAGALDRFAQFFIAPTISEDGIEREVMAVDSEHGKNLSSDAWRKSQVSKATANRTHPWARFSSGNRETLFTGPKAAGADPRVAVVDFYNAHYSADRCALAVLGRQPLGELEDMVRELFAPVPNKQLPPPSFASDMFLPEQLGVMLRVVPVREGQSLELTWQVPPSSRSFREHPLGYLSHLLGHEGEGSVFALLKARGWASALWAGESGGTLTFASLFTVHVDLTEEGERNIRRVAACVFSYLGLLRAPGGISQAVHEEVRGLAQLQFDTRDKSRPLTYCTNIANGLQLYPPQDMLPALYGVPRVFSPEAIREFLELLTPARVRLFWISKSHLKSSSHETASSSASDTAAAATAGAAAATGNGADDVSNNNGNSNSNGNGAVLLTEPIYGTRYDISPLPREWLAEWEAEVAAGGAEAAGDAGEKEGEKKIRLHLPAPNPFIPTDLSLCSDEAAAAPEHPQVAVAVPGRLRLWHKPETRFGQPKAVLNLNIYSPEAYASPRAAVMTRLFTKLMLDYLNEVAYPAQQAGLDYNLLNTQSGWQLSLGGFNHKLPELMAEVLGRLPGFKVLPDRFQFVREGLLREYANQQHNQPYSWAMYRGELLTTVRRWPLELYGGLAAEVSAEELQAFVGQRLHSRCFVEGLAAGNMRRNQVLHCARLLLGCLRDGCGAAPLHPAEMPELRVVRVPTQPPTDMQPPAAATAAAATAMATTETTGAGASGGGAEGSKEEGGSGSGSGGGNAVSDGCFNGWLFCEGVPNGTDENSAAVIVFQRGPDAYRSNSLGSLLVQLCKRDAFSELRTRQQLGYIVALHGSKEHGVGFMEMVVQSNMYDAEELCRRMDDFIAAMVETELPLKCGLAPAPTSEEEQAQQQQQQQGAETDAAATETAAQLPPSQPSTTSTTTPAQTEFEIAVEELAKSKLQAPKKLGDLVGPWWSEISHATYCFDRKEAEVAALRSVTPEELLAFARAQLTPGSPDCRKLSIQVRGKAEATRRQEAAAAASSSEASAAADTPVPSEPAALAAAAAAATPRLPYAPIPASDPFEWKRSCEAWPSVRALWAARRAAEGRPPLPESVAEAEAAEAEATEVDTATGVGAATAGAGVGAAAAATAAKEEGVAPPPMGPPSVAGEGVPVSSG